MAIAIDHSTTTTAIDHSIMAIAIDHSTTTTAIDHSTMTTVTGHSTMTTVTGHSTTTTAIGHSIMNTPDGILSLIDKLLLDATSVEEETLFVSSRLRNDILVLLLSICHEKEQIKERRLCVRYYKKIRDMMNEKNATVLESGELTCRSEISPSKSSFPSSSILPKPAISL